MQGRICTCKKSLSTARNPNSCYTEGVHIRNNDYHLMHVLQQRSRNTDMPLGQRSR